MSGSHFLFSDVMIMTMKRVSDLAPPLLPSLGRRSGHGHDLLLFACCQHVHRPLWLQEDGRRRGPAGLHRAAQHLICKVSLFTFIGQMTYCNPQLSSGSKGMKTKTLFQKFLSLKRAIVCFVKATIRCRRNRIH